MRINLRKRYVASERVRDKSPVTIQIYSTSAREEIDGTMNFEEKRIYILLL